MSDLQLLTRRQVADIVGVDPATIWRWVKNDAFPAGFPVGKCSTRWLRAEVQKWVENHAAERDRG